jgi:adenosyl cobinamide kinase/adenosyl cobinamide phosphate guanylyltransferase
VPFTFLVGGARSGKSRLAVHLAERAQRSVIFIATATAGDDEMEQRIAEHQEARPSTWSTIEEPRDLMRAIAISDPDSYLILDCLTLWVNNVFGESPEDVVLFEAGNAARGMAERGGGGVVVSNEVGLGIVPGHAETRHYRDLLGRVNTVFADHASEAFFVVAGRALRLTDSPG